MRKTGMVVAILLGSVCETFAADLYVKAAPPPPPLPPPPTWTRLYVGGLFGWGWAGDDTDNNDSVDAFAPTQLALVLRGAPLGFWNTPNEFRPRGNGFVGGGEFGGDYQVSPLFVVGGVIDGLWSGIKGTDTRTLASPFAFNINGLTRGLVSFSNTGIATFNAGENSFESLRIRAGFLGAPNWLIYGTVGGSICQCFANANFSDQIAASINGRGLSGTASFSESGSFNSSRTGIVFGAGTETRWGEGGHWGFKAQALHYDWGSADFSTPASQAASFTVPGRTTAVPLNALPPGLEHVHFQATVVEGGISYNW